MKLETVKTNYTPTIYRADDGASTTFTFKPINGFEMFAVLRYFELSPENLNKISLNIIDPDKALEIQKYIEKKINRKCEVKRLIEYEKYGKKCYSLFFYDDKESYDINLKSIKEYKKELDEKLEEELNKTTYDE